MKKNEIIYFQGFKAKYTGNTVRFYGEDWYEFKIIEGCLKDQLRYKRIK